MCVCVCVCVCVYIYIQASLVVPVSKESTCNAGDLDLIPGLGRSPGEGNGNPLQYSCLGNPMDRGAWQATVYVVTRDGHDLVTKLPLYIYIYMYKLYLVSYFLAEVYIQFSSVQSLSCVRLFATPGIAARQASLFITNNFT